jgi:hypothetical protein
MATTTTNFGWDIPQSTDLVKDGATAIAALGQDIDTAFIDLKGGTTGQVLAKASNTDLDYSWVAQDDSNAIQNAIVDAKGDLISATAADTPARLAVGTNGYVLTADSAEATGIKWAAVASGAINPNIVINGNFTVNQRAYVSAANLASGSYGFDRWKSNYTNTTLTFTSAPQGQEITINASGGLQQIIERANVPAGSYVLSWTGTATGRIYNSGGTPPSYAASPVLFTADGSANVVVEFTAVSTTKTLSKVKFELGSTATSFQYAGETIEGELANCQRYYWRAGGDNAYQYLANGSGDGSTSGTYLVVNPVDMRAAPTSIDFSTLGVTDGTTTTAATNIQFGRASRRANLVNATTASGQTQYRAQFLLTNNSTAGYIGFSAEL